MPGPLGFNFASPRGLRGTPLSEMKRSTKRRGLLGSDNAFLALPGSDGASLLFI